MVEMAQIAVDECEPSGFGRVFFRPLFRVGKNEHDVRLEMRLGCFVGVI